MWTRDGTPATRDNPILLEGEVGPDELLLLSESEWRKIFVREGIDFLWEEHSPDTRRALHQLMQSQFLRAVLEEDKPARKTRSASRRLQLGSDKDRPVGANDNEAGPSGSAMDLD